VDRINPHGMTPMADAITAAAQSLRHTEARATVILVSDGIETCNPDPCGAARILEETGVGFTAHVVGFDVSDPEALKQMQCIADATGGLFLSASDARELSAALNTVTAKVAEPVEAPVKTHEVAFKATLGEGGEDISGSVTWEIMSDGGSNRYEVDGSRPAIPLPNGAYQARARYGEAELGIDFVVAGQDRTVGVTFPRPAPKVDIIAPDSAPAGAEIEVGWIGPNEKGDNIQVGPAGSASYSSYTFVTQGNPLKLQLPAQPGSYEIRYKLQDRETIHRRLIEVTPREVDIIAPANAPAGAEIEVGWVGPQAKGDNIQVAIPGEAGYIFYTYLDRGNPLRLALPAQPGTYELRYRFRDSETIFTRPIEITAREVNIVAPKSAVAGKEIEVGWTGPDANGDNIQVGPPDSASYSAYRYLKSGNPLKLKMPDQPGTYELRYRFRDRETIFRSAITVTAPQ
jgi:Ca-activated chloride channel family protein